MFITALFIIARIWKQFRCPSADEWKRKLWYIYTMEYYSAMKKDTFESVLMMKLEPIIQSEVVWFSSVAQSDSLRHHELHAACQASLSITNSRSSLKLMSIDLEMPSSHHIFCHPLLLPPIPPSIRVFSNESTLCMRWPKYWSFSFSISLPKNTQD